MGGDDLDDGLLWEPVVAARDDASSSASASDDEEDEGDGVVVAVATSKKRKQQPTTTGTEDTSSKKKKGKKHSPAQLLLQAGRGIEREDKIQQAAFLTTTLQHYSLLEQQQNDKKKDEKNDNRLQILPSYCVGQTFDGSEKSTLVDRVRAAISVKKIKTWKHVGSPCVVRRVDGTILLFEWGSVSDLFGVVSPPHSLLCAYCLLRSSVDCLHLGPTSGRRVEGIGLPQSARGQTVSEKRFRRGTETAIFGCGCGNGRRDTAPFAPANVGGG